ncbi:MAG: VWA domain-containing protein, partial [Planctomycetes bacterium]|nr:VWA domain-containing protein [Planctomycetota bacterium]
MYFANPWGLLGLLALPAIVAIHMYHRRFPPMIVAGLHLWGAETQTRTAGRRLERLPITSTLLLELLAALLLSLVLSRPQWGDANSAVHLVVVLDNSASMSATTMQGKSFRDTVVENLERRVDSLPRGSVLTIIQTGRRPVMLAGPRTRWSVVKQQLDNWQPSANEHDFQPAWDLAAQLAEESGRLLFFTDHLPGADVPVPKLMEIVSVGRPGENVAVSLARWTFDSTSGKGNVFLRVGNYGTRTAHVTVLGRTREQDIFRRRVSIQAASATALEAEVPGGLGRLHVEVRSDGDRLGLDNRVTLIEPKVRTLDVAVALANNHPAFRPIQRVLAGISDLNVNVGESESAHLVIAPAEPLPTSRGNLWWLGVGPLDLSEQARKEAK